ncbi:hypothetical protein ACFV4T_12435 [Streptomyces sp. NPDC059755]|uniref:hypothetical protein n=1 Tax=Streptomyces sp. NPDC059755 TaxID=3346934 RepID=UPI00364D6429
MTVPSATQLRTENQALTQALEKANSAIRYMKVALAVMTGIIASLVTDLVVDHLGASPLATIGYSGSTFIVVTGFVFTIQEKIRRS